MSMRVAIAACLLSASVGASSAAPTLEQVWSTTGFANPESVIPGAGGDFYYVSNVDGEGGARDGNGFISKVAPDGSIIARQWAAGLDAPKGLALRGGRLYVADVVALVELDAKTGKRIARHEAADSGFLNDVAIAADGAVLVADSAKSRIYALREGVMSTWLEHEQLRSVNGLLPEADRLVVTTMAGKLLAVDWQSQAITVLAEGLGDADGVVALDNGEYLVGEWPGRLFHVMPDGKSTVLLDTREAKRFLNDFLLVDDILLVPNWEPSTLTAYRVKR